MQISKKVWVLSSVFMFLTVSQSFAASLSRRDSENNDHPYMMRGRPVLVKHPTLNWYTFYVPVRIYSDDTMKIVDLEHGAQLNADGSPRVIAKVLPDTKDLVPQLTGLGLLSPELFGNMNIGNQSKKIPGYYDVNLDVLGHNQTVKLKSTGENVLLTNLFSNGIAVIERNGNLELISELSLEGVSREINEDFRVGELVLSGDNLIGTFMKKDGKAHAWLAEPDLVTSISRGHSYRFSSPPAHLDVDSTEGFEKSETQLRAYRNVELRFLQHAMKNPAVRVNIDGKDTLAPLTSDSIQVEGLSGPAARIIAVFPNGKALIRQTFPAKPADKALGWRGYVTENRYRTVTLHSTEVRQRPFTPGNMISEVFVKASDARTSYRSTLQIFSVDKLGQTVRTTARCHQIH